jgi:predicted peptidase
MHYKKVVLFFCCCYLAATCYGQNQLVDHLKLDSQTIVERRLLLNNLPADKFEKRYFATNRALLPYRLLLPKNRTNGKKYPLVIALHNSSRLGDDNERQLEPLTRIWIREEIYAKYEAFVLAPQFKERSSNYVDEAGEKVSKPSKDITVLLNLIKEVEKEFQDIDRNRIYIIGYSMGASTAQNLLNLEPDHFAAMISMAGVPDFSNTRAIMTKPIWLIHGKKDIDNPYAGSIALFQKLKGNRKMVFTTYSYLDHQNITVPFLLSDAIPRWLFKHRQ